MIGLRLILRTNEDDWREMEVEGRPDLNHAGHDIPEFHWLNLLRAAGVEVVVAFDDFGQGEDS